MSDWKVLSNSPKILSKTDDGWAISVQFYTNNFKVTIDGENVTFTMRDVSKWSVNDNYMKDVAEKFYRLCREFNSY